MTKVGKKRKIVNPCTSHAPEAVPRPVVWEALFDPCCVGVPGNANGGAGVAGERGSCVPTPPAHSVL